MSVCVHITETNKLGLAQGTESASGCVAKHLRERCAHFALPACFAFASARVDLGLMPFAV